MDHNRSITHNKTIFTKKLMLLLVLALGFSASVIAENCRDIKIIDGRIMTIITVEGLRGSLKIPAVIDTGANISVIPQNIAEGIGYTHHTTEEFSTVGDSRKFKIIKIKKISMLGIDFNNIKVAIEPRQSELALLRRLTFEPKYSKKEIALIGMSELSKTNFSFKNKIFTICAKGTVKSNNNEGLVFGAIVDISKDFEYYRKDRLDRLDYGQRYNILGVGYYQGKVFRQSDNKALEYFSKACDLDNGEGCGHLGIMYYRGKGVKQDYFKADEYFKKACGLDYGLGCFNLGVMYGEGEGVKQNYFTALKYYEKACGLNNIMGCYNPGVMYIRGEGVRQNYSKALEYFSKACDLKHQLSCEVYTKLKKQY